MGDATGRVEMTGLPQALDVEHFAQARIQELEFLDAAVAAVSAVVGDGDSGGVGGSNLRDEVGTRPSAAGGLHDQSQAIPRHMRRRTTSHKPRRMPVALKNRSNAHLTNSTSKGRPQGSRGGSGASDGKKGKDPEAELTEGRRCRKQRRRPRALMEMHSPHAAEEEGVGDVGDDGKKRAGESILRPRCRWLETHIWHAKRMHMKEKWGFMLPAESNRGPRAAAEAALKHCTVQDITFMRPLELRGPRQCIQGALSVLKDPMDSRPTQRDCVDGSVEACTHLYRVGEFPLGCIAPVSILWAPPDTISANTPIETPASDESGGNDAEKGGGGEQEGRNEEKEEGIQAEQAGKEEAEEGLGDVRCLWVWVHPAAAKEALREIRKACTLEGSPWEGAVQAGPVPGGLCRLRVRGARSHETVQQVLRTAPPPPKPTADKSTAAVAEGMPGGFEDAARDNAGHWQALASSHGHPGGGSGKCGPRLLPSGSVLAITALDPRERHQYHQNHAGTDGAGFRKQEALVGGKPRSSKDAAAAAATVVEQWPPQWAAVSPLWDPDARAFSAELAAKRPDHVINDMRRRQRVQEAWDNSDGVTAAAAAAASIHGSHSGASPLGGVSGGSGSGATPVILVSTSGTATLAHGAASMAASTATAVDILKGDRRGSGCGKSSGAAGRVVEKKRTAVAAGWDIILPPGWAPVFFGALVLAGARALSLKDADGLRLESDEPCFPVDFPDTAAGRRHWDQIGQDAKASWTKTRPKHRGFKRRPPPPPPAPSPCLSRSLPLPEGTDEREEEITGKDAIGDGRGGGGGTSGDGIAAETKAEAESGGQGEEQQNESVKVPAPSSLPQSAVLASSFRPDFGSLATGGMLTSAGAGKATESSRSPQTGDGSELRDVEGAEGLAGYASGEAAAVKTSRRREEEVDGEGAHQAFAVARGFHYARAFLPDEEEKETEGSSASASVDADGDGDGRTGLALAPPPPLCLAFPTVLELTISLDKGVPEAGALIHAASPDHHALWMRGMQDGRLWPGLSPSSAQPSMPPSSLSPHVSTPIAGISATAAAGGGGDDPPPVAATALTAVGAVTSGGFSLLRGKGVGRAVCEAVAVRDAFWVSLSCSRRQKGGNAAGGRGKHRRQQGRPWALVLVGNEAGSWLRPAVAFVADS